MVLTIFVNLVIWVVCTDFVNFGLGMRCLGLV